MILHGYFRSSAAFRVRIALNLKGLAAEHVFHHLRHGEQALAPYVALNPQGLVPAGNEMITTLSRMYTDTLGEWAMYVFLVGAVAVLYSTFVASTASVPRLWTNTLALLGVLDFRDRAARERWIRILTMAMPPVSGV